MAIAPRISRQWASLSLRVRIAGPGPGSNCLLQKHGTSSGIARRHIINISRARSCDYGHGIGRSNGAVTASRSPGEESMPFSRRLTSSSSHPFALHYCSYRCGSSSSGQTKTQTLPTQFLEASNDQNFDPSTHQRNDVPFDPIDGKPPLPSSSSPVDEGKNDSKSTPSSYSNSWIDTQLKRWRADSNDFDCYWSSSLSDTNNVNINAAEKKSNINNINTSTLTSTSKRILWSNWTEGTIRNPAKSPILFQYDNLVVKSGSGNNDGKEKEDSSSKNNKNEEERQEQEERLRLLKVLYQYGLVLVTGTPTRTESLPDDAMSDATKMTQTSSNTNSFVDVDVDDANNETAESAILNLASMIGYHPLQTLYGSGVWSTSSQSSFYNNNNNDDSENTDNGNANANESTSTADSAYGSTSLPLHTDMTYISNPPGVQVFLMVQPATAPPSESKSNNNDNDDNDADNNKNIIIPKGTGQSVYLDGFAAAQQLLVENPAAFHLLATTPRTYRCIDDEEGWHLEATGPLIETVVPNGTNEWPPIKSIRHNDLDRLPDLPPYPAAQDTAGNEIQIHNDAFYQKLKDAHEAWDNILRRDSMRLVINLQPGDCVLVANQRCMHGRYAFETSKFPRVVMGCYVGMDELSSKWRKSGLDIV